MMNIHTVETKVSRYTSKREKLLFHTIRNFLSHIQSMAQNYLLSKVTTQLFFRYFPDYKNTSLRKTGQREKSVFLYT